MKQILSLTAVALVEYCARRPPHEVAAACDAALTFLTERGYLPAMLRRFRQSVEREVRRRGGGGAATLSTPQGDAGAQRSQIVSALERRLGATVELFESREPALLGGAVLALKDDRLDASLRGALDHLSMHLRSQP